MINKKFFIFLITITIFSLISCKIKFNENEQIKILLYRNFEVKKDSDVLLYTILGYINSGIQLENNNKKYQIVRYSYKETDSYETYPVTCNKYKHSKIVNQALHVATEQNIDYLVILDPQHVKNNLYDVTFSVIDMQEIVKEKICRIYPCKTMYRFDVIQFKDDPEKQEKIAKELLEIIDQLEKEK